MYNCYPVWYHYSDGNHVYSVPRASTLLTRCNSVDECYYSDSESWLCGSQRTFSSAGSAVNQTLHDSSDQHNKEAMRNLEICSSTKKPQVSPRLHKPVAAPRKNVLPNVTLLHNGTRALNIASAKLLINDNKRYSILLLQH